MDKVAHVIFTSPFTWYLNECPQTLIFLEDMTHIS